MGNYKQFKIFKNIKMYKNAIKLLLRKHIFKDVFEGL